MFALTLALPLLVAPAPAAPASAADGSGLVALRAGTVHLVEDGAVLEDGTVLVRDGRIVAAGADLEIPPGAQVVDYGPGAVIVPGLVAASSPYGLGTRPAASPRTADPALLATDGFDFYASHAVDLASGVTSAYANPASGRLIAGQGGVFKLAGEGRDGRTLNPSAALHGSISSDARRVGVFWEFPIPPTADVGIGEPERQYPGSTMGAIWALGELLDAARTGREAEGFGPRAAADLAPLVERGLPWRIRAESRMEVRALADFAARHDVPILIEGATQAGDLGAEIAASGAAVIFELPYTPERAGRSLGTHPDTVWPEYDVAARLVADGVRVAFSTGGSTRHLRFAAALCSRGGLDPAAALRAITLTPAELLGVADRVGSIRAGKDADLVVLNGPPLGAGSSVLATWVGGKLAWSSPAPETAGAVVLSVDELHVGDGTVIAPAQVLLRDGRIAEVGRSVSRPAGARLVRGAAAMPGMIDALGYLGLEGSSKVPPTDYEMSRLVAPGDVIDRRVANAGVTTVALSPRRESKTGAPVMVYKPAAVDAARAVVEDPAAVRLSWKDNNRLNAGDDVRKLLEKAVEYDREWREYEKEMAAWTPPPPEKEKVSKDDEEGDDEEKAEEADEKKDDKKDKKDKKKKDEPELDPDPVTGIWTASVVRPPMAEGAPLRLQIRNRDGSVEGLLRSVAVSDGLVEVSGTYERVEIQSEEAGADGGKAEDDGKQAGDDDEKDDEDEGEKKQKSKKKKGKKDEKKFEQRLVLSGLGTEGWFTIEGLIEGEIDEPELVATLELGAASLELKASRESREYPVAKLPEWRKPPEEEKAKPPKGMPKEPREDSKLEPLRKAIHGETVVIVEVDREDEILDCVDAFEAAGIRPVLLGGEDAHWVADRIRGRVRGVLLDHQVLESKPRWGTRTRNRYADLQAAGIPVAFHSSAEEGAADLPLMAAFAVSEGMSATGALRALTGDAAAMLGIDDLVGRIAPGLAADVLLLDGSPLELTSQVLRTWVNGVEIP